MDSKIILLIVLLVLMLLFTGCTKPDISNTSQSNQTFNTSSNESGAKVQTANESNIQVVDKCSQISDIAEKIDCYLALAKDTNNSSFCDKAMVDDTDTGFWSVVSTYGPDYLIWVDRHRITCYNEIARATNNPVVCDKINEVIALADANKVLRCKDEASVDKSMWCNRVDASSRDKCFYGYAQDEQNNAFCSFIQDSAKKDHCYNIVAQLTGNLEMCKLTKEEQDCYHQIAVKKLSLSICNNIQDDSKSNYCKWIIIKNTRNVNDCSELDSQVDKTLNSFNSSKDECFEYFSHELNKYEYCAPIEDTKRRDTCYLYRASSTKDYKACEFIIDKDLRLPCLSSMGQKVPTKQNLTVIVKGDQALSPTGICVEKDTSMTINASGNVVFSGGGSNASPSGVDITLPEGFYWPCDNAKGVSLIMKLGSSGPCMEVGQSKTLLLAEDSEIYLGVNDEYLPGNTGEWNVTIQAFTKDCEGS